MNAVEAVGGETIMPAEALKTIEYVSKAAIDNVRDLKEYLQVAMQASAEREVERQYRSRKVVRIEHGEVKIKKTYIGPSGQPLEEPQHYAVLRTNVYALPEGIQ